MDLSERPGDNPNRHPWETTRCEFFRAVLCHARARRARRVLDVGAGDAWFSSVLAGDLGPDASFTCWDSGYSPDVVQGLAANHDDRFSLVAERPQGEFDLVLLLDVLEHVDDDLGTLRSIVTDNMSPAAITLISVPAWPLLFTNHDAQLQHRRRYTPAAARSLAQSAGLRIMRGGGLFHSLVAPRALSKVWELLKSTPPSSKPPSLSWNHNKLLTLGVQWALRLDGRISAAASHLGAEVPGLSWWALCEKPLS